MAFRATIGAKPLFCKRLREFKHVFSQLRPLITVLIRCLQTQIHFRDPVAQVYILRCKCLLVDLV